MSEGPFLRDVDHIEHCVIILILVHATHVRFSVDCNTILIVRKEHDIII